MNMFPNDTVLMIYLVVVFGLAALAAVACLGIGATAVVRNLRVRRMRVQLISNESREAAGVAAPLAGDAAVRPSPA